MLWIAALTLLLLIGPVLDRRGDATSAREFVRATAISLVLLAAGSAIVGLALALELGGRPPSSALLLTGGATIAAAIALVAGPVVRLRLALRARRRNVEGAPAGFLFRQLCAGFAIATILVAFELLLPRVVDPVTDDLRRFSLYPWDGNRLAMITGILACHAAALWTCTLILSAALARWRVSRAPRSRIRLLLLWAAPSVAVAALAPLRGWSLPPAGLVLSAVTCAVAALSATRTVVWYRHTTVVARIFALFAAFLLPALLLYPSVDYFAERAMRPLIESRYATQAQQYSETLQQRLTEARSEIDALGTLPTLVTDDPNATAPCQPTQGAYLVWSRTALARARLTSAVELYNPSCGLVSRFALNLPEYSGTAQAPQIEAASPCQWDVFGEAAPFGADERRMLHAARQICAPSAPGAPPRIVGTIVVHVLVFDLRTLPFITSQNPYFEVFRPTENGTAGEDAPRSDVEVAIYGWSLGAIYNSPHAAWSIGDDLFRRIYDPARRPFWTTVRTSSGRYRVFFSNDRVFIYAIGYRTLTPFDHLVHLAELTTLAGAVYVLVLVATPSSPDGASASAAGPRSASGDPCELLSQTFPGVRPRVNHPVLILAVAIRWYFAEPADCRRRARSGAHRSGRAAGDRAVECADAAHRRARAGERRRHDLDQPGHRSGRQHLRRRESRRDEQAGSICVGASRPRTPAGVYRAIALQRLPSFVGEDRIGSVPYTVAAAPVHAGEKKVILTVPLATRQRDIDREIDELDRGVHLAALLFVLLGAAIGLSMAERIADPIRRLTRATRRIARGDFDAQNRRPLVRRAASPGRRVQQHGGRTQGAAHPARTHASSRGLGGDGAAGRPRDQEPAHADSALG